MKDKIAVLGAGIVGVCSALELRRRGADVTLFDRKDPGLETSYGNAGVLARSSFMPYNNPDLIPSIPGLLTNTQTKFHYDPIHLLKQPFWGLQFLLNARLSKLEETTTALNELITLSLPLHRELLAEGNSLDRLSENGWMFLYRKAQQYDGSKRLRHYLDRFSASYACLEKTDIIDAQPALKPIFERALWIKDGASVNDPSAIVKAYANLFIQAGGKLEKSAVSKVERVDERWTLDGGTELFDKVIICLGPWSKEFLGQNGYRVRMSYERGYHRHYVGDGRGNKGLTTPVYDTAAGYVLAPLERGLRLSSGTELADIHAKPNECQIKAAEKSAKEAIDLGDRIEEDLWLGSRPTFPDSRPVIGKLPKSKGLYVAFGHQHVGLSTGTGTARLLAEVINEQKTSISPKPFEPSRFIHRGLF